MIIEPSREFRTAARIGAVALSHPRVIATFMIAAALGGACATGRAQEAPQSRSFNAPVQNLQWRPQAPNLPIMISELWGNRDRDGGFGELVQVPPDFNSGRHAHSGDFHAVLIKGTWIHEAPNGEGSSQRLMPGSYIRQAGGEMHIDRCVSAEPCVLFLFQYARADVIWPDRPR
jgi:beta-alanine degradation protein BauB